VKGPIQRIHDITRASSLEAFDVDQLTAGGSMARRPDGVGQFYHHGGRGAVCRIVRRRPSKRGTGYSILVFSAIYPEGEPEGLAAHDGLEGWTWIDADRAHRLLARYGKLAAKRGDRPLRSETFATVWQALTDTPEEAEALEREANLRFGR
jgi:hypothetical protein